MKLRDLHALLLATDKGYAQAAREVDAAQSLADRVVALRVAAGLTQAQLAKKARISQPRLSRLESGFDNPTLETLERVGDALGVRLDYTPPQMSLPLLTMANMGTVTTTGPFMTSATYANVDLGSGIKELLSDVMGTVAVTYVAYEPAAKAEYADAA